MSVRRLLTTAGLLLLLSAACGDDPVQPPPLESASPSATSTPKAESAADFMRRWFAANNNSQASGETKTLRSLGRGCDSCEQLADRIDGIYAAGGYIKGGASTVGRVKRRAGTTFDVKVTSTPTTYADSAAGPTKSFPGGVVDFLFVLERTATGWLVTEYSELNEPVP